jgi:hypothetical protein
MERSSNLDFPPLYFDQEPIELLEPLAGLYGTTGIPTRGRCLVHHPVVRVEDVRRSDRHDPHFPDRSQEGGLYSQEPGRRRSSPLAARTGSTVVPAGIPVGEHDPMADAVDRLTLSGCPKAWFCVALVRRVKHGPRAEPLCHLWHCSAVVTNDFRTIRAKLPDEAFALVDGPEPEPTDPVEPSIWSGIASLPDDVSLRTADFHGEALKHAYEAWGYWISLVLDAQQLAEDVNVDALAVATSNAIDEFQASFYAALTGFYRQAIGVLRSITESMLAAAYFKRVPVADQKTNLEQWLSGHKDGLFAVGPRRKQLARVAPFDRFEERDASFLSRDDGWFAWLYGLLCAFVHARPAHADANGIVLYTTNGGMWSSNGPIYVARAFEFWEVLYFDAMLLALFLAGLSDERLPRLERPNDVPFMYFLECLMEWHPAPGPPPTAAAIARYLFPGE